jgi:hypothetical protein
MTKFCRKIQKNALTKALDVFAIVLPKNRCGYIDSQFGRLERFTDQIDLRPGEIEAKMVNAWMSQARKGFWSESTM